jgi:hypothetical protein
LHLQAQFINEEWIVNPCCGAGACQAAIVGFVGLSAWKQRRRRAAKGDR